MAQKNGNTVKAHTRQLVLALIAERRAAVVNSRRLAEAQLGRAHAVVGVLSVQLEQLDRARADVLNEHAQAA